MVLGVIYSRYKITKEFLELYKEDFKMMQPKCEECKKPLGIGDYIDAYFPHYDEYNICRECDKGVK